MLFSDKLKTKIIIKNQQSMCMNIFFNLSKYYKQKHNQVVYDIFYFNRARDIYFYIVLIKGVGL